MKNEIVKINASDYGLEETKAQEIEAMFLPMLSKMKDLEKEFNHILKLPIDPETCQMAKDLRMAYVKTRTGTDKIHKELKAFYLSGGRFVDAFKNTQSFASGEKEQVLKSIEDHFENQERERIEKIRMSRENLLKNYTEIMPLALGNMEQGVFDNYLAGVKLAYDARIAAEKKAEEDRIAREKADMEARETQRLENIRLRAEAEERERLAEIELKKQADILAAERAKAETERKERERLAEIELKKQADILAAERAKAETERKERERLAEIELKKQADILAAERAKAKTERKERERLEFEIEKKRLADEKAKRDNEAKIEADRKAQIAADKKAASAPDKVKLIALSEIIGRVELPEVKSEEAKEIIENTKILLHKTVKYLLEKSKTL